MRCAYFDCFSGAAGDMILAAMIHAGCPVVTFEDVIGRLKLRGVTIRARPASCGGIAATHVDVQIDPAAHGQHRGLTEILKLIASAGLASSVGAAASSIFRRLAEAEAAAHGVPTEQVHFHEIGAEDALVDIVGACAGVEQLGLERIVCSPIPTGHGSATCAHGVLPVPAPATANLLKGVPLAHCEEEGELTTPTGAAILTTLAAEFGPLPAMRIEAVGYGAGARVGRSRPNFLRLLIGDAQPAPAAEQDLVTVLEAQIDDASGQVLAYACERLLEAGALDAYIVPIIMKKGRPGQLLTVLGRPEDVATLEDVVLRETTTYGVRRYQCLRSKLAREHVPVATRYGEIRVKIGRRGGQTLQAWPEYEDCVAAARRAGVALRAVQQEALRVWMMQSDAR